MPKVKVSVIIPVYNVSAYIERCARSLFEQTLDDMEYIFVDDCSSDNSVGILERVVQDYVDSCPNSFCNRKIRLMMRLLARNKRWMVLVIICFRKLLGR